MSDRAQKGWVLALTSTASFMIALDALVVTTALTRIRLSLGVSLETLEWTINAYTLSFAVLLLTATALGERFGRRRMFVAGLGIFTLASATCGLAPAIGWLLAGRTVQGAGAALVMPLAMALLGNAFPREERARALGLFGGLTGLALLGGPVVGGAIAESGAWRWIFWLNLPIGVITIPLVLRYVPESRGGGARVDLPGVVLATGAALGLVWGLVRGNAAGWTSVEVAGTLAAGGLLATAFVAWERRAAHPMVPMRFFASPAFASGNAAGFLLYGAIYGMVFFMAQFLQTAQGNTSLGAGLRLLPWTAPLFVIAPVAGAVTGRIGERVPLVVGLTLQAAGAAWLAMVATPHLPYSALVAPLVIAGTGGSMAMPAAQSAVLGAVAPQEVGQASGTFNMLRFLGGTFGIAITAATFTATGGYRSAETFTAGFVHALGVAAALSLLAALAGLWQPGRTVPRGTAGPDAPSARPASAAMSVEVNV